MGSSRMDPTGSRRGPLNMGGAETTFGQGRADTAATIGGGRGGGALEYLLAEALRRKMAPPAPTNQRGGRAIAVPNYVPTENERRAEKMKMDMMAAQLQQAQAAAKIAKESSEPIRKKYIGGMGTIGGYVPDYTLGARALMPGNASIIGGGGSGEGGESIVNGAGAAKDFQRFGRESAVRKRISDLGYGYGG